MFRVALLLATTIGFAAGAATAFSAPEIEQLGQYKTVDSAQQKAKAVSTFKSYLLRLNGKAAALTCSNILHTRLGRIEEVYVGDCRLKNGPKVVICGDTAVGEFTLSYSFDQSTKPKDSDLGAFSRQNCRGG